MVDLVKRLRSIDHISVEDCFMQSQLYAKAADRIEELEAKLAEVTAHPMVQALVEAAGKVSNAYWYADPWIAKRVKAMEAALAALEADDG